MHNIAQFYTDNIHRHFRNLYATWPTNTPLRLGDVGILKGNIFELQSNLAAMANLDVQTRLGDDNSATYSYQSDKSMVINSVAKGEAKAAGEALAKAKLEIAFGAEDAVYFNAALCRIDSIADQISLGRKIIELFKQEQWDPNLCVVTGLVRSGATTIIVSSGKNAKITLEADAEVPSVDLAEAGLNLNVRSETGIGLKVVAERNATPLIRVARLRRKWRLFGPQTFNLAEVPPTALDSQFKEHIRQKGLSFEDMVEFVELEADDITGEK